MRLLVQRRPIGRICHARERVTGDKRGSGGIAARHGADRRTTVSDELIDALGIVDLDEKRLVKESFEFLLERELSTSIMKEFDLADISDYFPDYLDEIQLRITD